MLIIGLTGGIASGKTTAASMFERLGVPVIDADQLAREVVEPGGETLARIVDAFGDKVLNPDGSLNRTQLGAVVFADPIARRTLEEIIHPAIRALAEEKLQRLRETGTGTAFYVAPLLFEAGITSRVHEVWVVYVDRETQLERLMARDHLSREAALSRIASQMPMEEKKKLGRIVIDNRGGKDELEAQVLRLWREEIADRETKRH